MFQCRVPEKLFGRCVPMWRMWLSRNLKHVVVGFHCQELKGYKIRMCRYPTAFVDDSSLLAAAVRNNCRQVNYCPQDPGMHCRSRLLLLSILLDAFAWTALIVTGNRVACLRTIWSSSLERLSVPRARNPRSFSLGVRRKCNIYA